MALIDFLKKQAIIWRNTSKSSVLTSDLLSKKQQARIKGEIFEFEKKTGEIDKLKKEIVDQKTKYENAEILLKQAQKKELDKLAIQRDNSELSQAERESAFSKIQLNHEKELAELKSKNYTSYRSILEEFNTIKDEEWFLQLFIDSGDFIISPQNKKILIKNGLVSNSEGSLQLTDKGDLFSVLYNEDNTSN